MKFENLTRGTESFKSRSFAASLSSEANKPIFPVTIAEPTIPLLLKTSLTHDSLARHECSGMTTAPEYRLYFVL